MCNICPQEFFLLLFVFFYVLGGKSGSQILLHKDDIEVMNIREVCLISLSQIVRVAYESYVFI